MGASLRVQVTFAGVICLGIFIQVDICLDRHLSRWTSVWAPTVGLGASIICFSQGSTQTVVHKIST